MPLPEPVLDFLAKEYYRECIDPCRYPFIAWASLKAEKLGYRL